MTKPLSTAAQAILDAYGNFEAANTDAMAAALRAAAYQIQFEGQLGMTAYGGQAQAQRQLNTIAAELEAS
jgi:3D (Asp-Asp-Asp) domain-containing protein